ncbi:MAG: hypothetical protein JNM27_00585 [Leptospirales bacterium]|nr:hypothetical protein [Leptospirales bacterium]
MDFPSSVTEVRLKAGESRPATVKYTTRIAFVIGVVIWFSCTMATVFNPAILRSHWVIGAIGLPAFLIGPSKACGESFLRYGPLTIGIAVIGLRARLLHLTLLACLAFLCVAIVRDFRWIFFVDFNLENLAPFIHAVTGWFVATIAVVACTFPNQILSYLKTLPDPTKSEL